MCLQETWGTGSNQQIWLNTLLCTSILGQAHWLTSWSTIVSVSGLYLDEYMLNVCVLYTIERRNWHTYFSVHFHNVWFLKLGFELSITLKVTLGYSRGVKWQSRGTRESTSACLQPHTSHVSLKQGFHQIFSLIFFCFMMSSEIFPIFMENFF